MNINQANPNFIILVFFYFFSESLLFFLLLAYNFMVGVDISTHFFFFYENQHRISSTSLELIKN